MSEMLSEVSEAERWFTGTVENGISNALLVRMIDTQKEIWIVVNAATELPTKAANPGTKETVRDMPLTMDDQGEKKTVEFAIKEKYFGALDAAAREYALKIYDALEKGHDVEQVQPVVPVVHAAKFANHRSQFFPKATAEQAGLTNLCDDLPVSGATSLIIENDPNDIPHVLREGAFDAPTSGVRLHKNQEPVTEEVVVISAE